MNISTIIKGAKSFAKKHETNDILYERKLK